MKFITGIFIAILFCTKSLNAQPYGKVDSIMRNYKEKIRSVEDLYKLVNFIRNNFAEDSLKLRASFIWITENIQYDVEAFKKEDLSAAQLPYVIKHKKAICSGYASLLKYFCDAFGIESSIVDGYARSGNRSIILNQTMLRPNHAWNAVKINNEWRLIDPTWAAGSVDNRDEDKLKYYKNFNECYYFTPPDKLILNHFPRQNRFQLVPKIVHEMDFKKAPLFTSVYLSDSIKKVFPDTALIKGKSGDTLIIKFKTNAEPGKMCAWSDILQKATHSGYAVRKDEWIEYHYPIQATGFYNLYIGYYDNRHAVPLIAYKMEIK